MKKLHYFFILFLLCAFAFTSCQKDKAEIKDESTNSEVAKITRKLQIFKQNLQSKSGETMPADSAEWYLEGLLNYEQANNSHVFGDVDFYYDTLAVNVANGQISLDELNYLYTVIDNRAEAIRQATGNENYTFDIVDLKLETTGLKSGTQDLIVSLSGGIIGSGLNYVPFGPSDYWYWGYGMGKCDEYTGQYLGRDATTELQRKFRNPIAVPGAGYFISVESILEFPGAPEFDDPYNAPYGGTMIYSQGGLHDEFDQCLSPEDLNYYLGKFDFIRNTRKPIGKQYKTVNVNYDISSGIEYWYHIHTYTLFYGIKIENPL